MFISIIWNKTSILVLVITRGYLLEVIQIVWAQQYILILNN